MRLSLMYQAAKLKATPPEAADPNEAVDLKAAAARARETLVRYVAALAEDDDG